MDEMMWVDMLVILQLEGCNLAIKGTMVSRP